MPMEFGTNKDRAVSGKKRKGREMNNRWKDVFAGLAAAFLTLGAACTVWASPIGTLSISVEDSAAEGVLEEPEIIVSPSSCEISSVKWSKEVEDWKPGKMIYGYLTISAAEGREFERSYKSSKCSINNAELKSASSSSDDPSSLHVTIRYTPKVQLGATEEAGWSNTDKTLARWKKVPYATMYELRLYQNDDWVKTLETASTSADVSPYIKEEGDYYYAVRAKGRTDEERKYLLTGEYVTSEDIVFFSEEDIGQSQGIWQNFQEGKKYRLPGGTYPASQWVMILGKWYYFDEQGFLATGWLYDEKNSRWYYLDGEGGITVGWKEIEGKWYYFQADGEMAVGWIEENPGVWYYMNPDGSMAADTVIDNQYFVDSSGRCTTFP